MRKILLLIFIFFSPLNTHSLDSYFVKDPNKDFFKRYYTNLFEWSKKVILDKEKIKSSGIEKCFLEWRQNDSAKKRFLTDKRVLRPMMYEFKKNKNTLSWNILLISNKKLKCLGDSHGGRWSSDGKLISTFKWGEGSGGCLKKKLKGALFETSKSSCKIWRFDEFEITENIIKGFRSYSTLRVESAKNVQSYFFFKAFDTLSLSDIDRKTMRKFKYDWKILVHGINFDSNNDYNLLLP